MGANAGMGADAGMGVGSGMGVGGRVPGGVRRPPQNRKPLTYADLAKIAFQRGQETDAFNFLYAHALTTDAGAGDVLSKIQWVPGLKSPSLAVRWGVGVEISPDNFAGDLKPVGSIQQLPTRRGGGGYGGYGGRGAGGSGAGMEGGMEGPSGAMGGMQGGSGGMGGGGPRNNALAPYAGELGDQLLNAFQSRVANGHFGLVLKEAPPATSSGAMGGAAGYGMGGSGMGGSGGEEYGDESGGEEGDEYSGPPGGMGPSGMGPGGMGLPGPPGGVGPSGMGPSGMGPSGVGPGGAGMGGGAMGTAGSTAGLTLLGVGKKEQLLEKAAQQGIQVLAFFDVEVKFNVKTRLTTNETKLTLYDVSKRKSPEKERMLTTTRPFNNLKIQNDRSQNKDDGIEKEFTRMFEFVDESLRMTPLPEGLNTDNVKRRAAGIAAARHDHVLPVLAELRFWNRKNLLPAEDLETAYKMLLGDERGSQLANGDEETKKKVVATWLPKT
jgi:hypothetical protein